MEIKTATVTCRGKTFEVEVPGRDAESGDYISAILEALLVALHALEDPRVDGVLAAYGILHDDPRTLFVAQCTDLEALECPVCGECSCEVFATSPDGVEWDAGCPLHGVTSNHAKVSDR